jgi:hypothetical protein
MVAIELIKTMACVREPNASIVNAPLNITARFAGAAHGPHTIKNKVISKV